MNRNIFFVVLGIAGLIACGSQVEVPSQSAGSVSGAGGYESSSMSATGAEGSSGASSSSGEVDPCKDLEYPEYHPCCGKEDDSSCQFQKQEGFCQEQVCIICEGKKLGEVVKGFPIDPEACYQYVCLPDPGSPTIAFPTVQYHPLEEKCTYKALEIEGTCSEDGQCCGWVEKEMDHICGPGASE